jgi:hypothetical protein
MRNLLVTREISRLDDLFSKITDVTDLELQAHWAKYLCILVSGFIENSIKAILIKYCRDCSNQFVSDFVESQMSNMTNFGSSKILKLIQSFNPTWESALSDYLQQNEDVKTALDSVVANRHLIAHGKNIGMSFVDMRDYYQSVKRFFDFMETVIS